MERTTSVSVPSDAAGNESALGPALSVTIDTAAPAAPAAPDLQAASDTGTSDTDNITADNTPTFDLSGASPYFRFYRDSAKISGDYEAGATYTTAVQADGTYSYQVSAVDAAGNESAKSTGLSVTIDTSASAAPSAPDLQAASDTGVSNSDNITNLDNSTSGKTLQFAVSGHDFRGHGHDLRRRHRHRQRHGQPGRPRP